MSFSLLNKIFVKNSNAQLKLFESMAVLIVFIVLVAFGSNFYFASQRADIERESSRFEQLRAVEIALSALFLPELSCTVVGLEKCVDRRKAEAFSDLMKESLKRQKYFAFLGYSNIFLNVSYFDVQKEFPQSAILNLYNNVPASFSSSDVFKLPVVVCEGDCDPAGIRRYSFAVLEVASYVK